MLGSVWLNPYLPLIKETYGAPDANAIDPNIYAGQSPSSEQSETFALPVACAIELPEGTRILSTSRHGTSLWGTAVKINTERPDRQAGSYFLKVIIPVFTSLRSYRLTLMSFSCAKMNLGAKCYLGNMRDRPHFTRVPRISPPNQSPGVHSRAIRTSTSTFVISTIESRAFPVWQNWVQAWPRCILIACLKVQNCKFGFHVTTYVGALRQDNAWTDTWEEFFTRTFQYHLDYEASIQRPQGEEMKKLSNAMVKKVIPGLLRPLESDGQRVKPCIIHGDLWYDNVKIDARTQKPIVFDACAFWGHNECKMRDWAI